MSDDAQWEIQKLLESRDKASSNENVKREFEIVAFQERPRRKVSEEGRWWGRKGVVEWLIVIKGETVDHKTRVTPDKHEDPWNPKPKQQVLATPPRIVTPVPAPAMVPVMQCPAIAAQNQACVRQRLPVQAGTVLRHVENRRVMSVEEAERKMEEIVKDLF